MKLEKTYIGLKTPYLIVLVATAVLLIFIGLFFLLGTKSNEYYIVFNDVYGLEVANPVVLEDVIIGKIDDIYFHEDGSGLLMVKLAISNNINIPSRSIARISRSEIIEGNEIRIEIHSSDEYLKSGDTIRNEEFPLSVDSLIELSDKVNNVLQKEFDDSVKNTQPELVDKKKLVYRIQIFVSSSELNTNSKRFKGLNDVEQVEEGTVYKYYVGEKKHLNEILLLKDSIRNIGFTDAFIVPFMNNKRISMGEANEFLKN